MTDRLLAACLLCFFAAMFSASCDTERDPCLQPVTAYLRVRSMRHVTDTTTADSLLPNARWRPLGSDSLVLISFGKNVSRFSLSLNPEADSARYVIQPDSANATFDTLTFIYGRRLQFLSNACGYTYFYTLRNVVTTFHNIDSLRLKNDEINGNVNTPEHVQVFF